MIRVPAVSRRAPRAPVPPALAKVLAELRALHARGELPHEAVGDALPLVIEAVDGFDEDERAAQLEPFWQLGASVGVCRE